MRTLSVEEKMEELRSEQAQKMDEQATKMDELQATKMDQLLNLIQNLQPAPASTASIFKK